MTGFSDGSASYSLQASIGGGLANGGSVEGRYGPGAYQEAANTTAGKVVQGVVTGLTDAVGQVPIAGLEAGTEGAQTLALPAEEITFFGTGRALGQAAGTATDAAESAIEAAIHGNSKLSPRIAYLYQLFTKEGQFLKNGITQNLTKRYTTRFMTDKVIVPIDKGSRVEMLAKERQMTTSSPGPLNREPWAGTGP